MQLQDMIEDLKALPAQVEMLLNNKEKDSKICQSLSCREGCIFIGRGIDYAISMEGSLKLKRDLLHTFRSIRSRRIKAWNNLAD